MCNRLAKEENIPVLSLETDYADTDAEQLHTRVSACGMSILLEPEHLEAARACIEKHNAPHHAIVPLEGQIKSKRDKYC